MKTRDSKFRIRYRLNGMFLFAGVWFDKPQKTKDGKWLRGFEAVGETRLHALANATRHAVEGIDWNRRLK